MPEKQTATSHMLLTMCDQAGITRVKLIPESKCESAVRNGVSFSLTSALLLGADDSIADLPDFPTGHGDVRLYPDASAQRTIDRNTGLIWLPADQRIPDGQPFSVCQRSILRQQVDRFQEKGLDPIMAFEIEFAVYRKVGEDWELADENSAYGISSFVESERWFSDVIEAFDLAGIPLEQIHPEYGIGQYEVALGVRDPLTAVDDYVLARILLTRVLHSHGLRVSFSPKPESRASGNGCHIHVSASRDGANIFAGAETSTDFSTFGGQWVGALVDHLPATIALFAPGPHSYARLQPGAFSGAFSCWGVENREAAVRYIPGPAGRRNRGANVEVKVPDNTGNPYLSAAAILALGLYGLDAGTSLPAPLVVVPAKATPAELYAARAAALPGSLFDALQLLGGNEVLRSAFGNPAIDSFVGLRTLDLPAQENPDPEVLFTKYRWQQ